MDEAAIRPPTTRAGGEASNPGPDLDRFEVQNSQQEGGLRSKAQKLSASDHFWWLRKPVYPETK